MTKNRPRIADNDLEIIAEKQGATEYTKISYPLRYGCYGQIRTPDYIFQFNRNAEIKTVQGRSGDWLTASEWLKRTAGDDWQYFSAGGYSGAYNYTGEYYIPCLPYQTNTLFGGDAFQRPGVRDAFAAWHRLYRQIEALDLTGLDRDQADFIRRIRRMTPERLEARGRQLHEIIGGIVSVLPPDARHAEYDIIPVTVADGCLYNCGFCRVKTGRGFSVRSRQSVTDQLRALKNFYDRDLVNYNAVFLGQHDALNAGREMLLFAAEKAWEILEMDNSVMKNPRMFLFGSADSILRADDGLFDALNSLPFHTYINLGLESGDGPTLSMLRKPLSPAKVEKAFARMLEVNRRYQNIEITANFVIGEGLPETHLSSIIELTRNRLDRFCPKGAAYLSPLEDIGDKNRLLTKFNELKTLCRLPAYIYLIQRL
ncbi:MAG: radical SAM domain-containing protein [Desulfobacteraceae bacterium]|nr:radical SAM domain-containing protein [Desulfobacteraceae bacterium]